VRNWAGNLEYRARGIHEPASVDELRELVARTPRIRALGSRHSFSDVADTAHDLVSLARLPRRIAVDAERSTVTIDGAIRYGELCRPLDESGFALHNMASLPHISVAGACATATHGSGDRSGNLATAVSAIEIVAADGEIVRLDRSHDSDFAGAVVGLGALGVVTQLTLDVEPAYLVAQAVYEDLPVERFGDRFDEITTAGDSVSFFTEWRGPTIDQVWVKRRVADSDADDVPRALFGAVRATADRHPIRGLPADACTEQRGIPGPWHARLPHFRMDHTPSSGDELQSEYFVARRDAAAAFDALMALRDRIAPLVQVSEIRTIAEDDLWLSPAFGRPSVAFHFTWRPDWPGVRTLLPAIEAALRPFGPRPHWGKLSTIAGDELRPRYERLADFVALATRLDPGRTFRNDYVDRLVFGEGAAPTAASSGADWQPP
jgi:xylitol oxidase